MRSHLLMFALILAFGTGCTNSPVPVTPPPAPVAPTPVLLGAWYWIGSLAADRVQIAADPQRYRLEFSDDVTVLVQADCNRGRASYSRPKSDQLIPGPIGLSKMGCASDSQDRAFVAQFAASQGLGLSADWMVLDSADKTGQMYFARDAAQSLQTYACEQGTPFWVSVGVSSALLLADGQSYRLDSAPASAGVRFSAGPVALEFAGTEATLTGLVARSGCRRS